MARCERCNRRVGSDYWLCRGCSDLLDYSEMNRWVVSLGASIRRFVRRVEAKRLAREIRWHADQMSSLDDEVSDSASDDLDVAISRLVALAVGGDDGGSVT